MLLLWDAIEADFIRDYRIDLMQELENMTWRRFLVLLHNVNPYGAVSARIRAELDKQDESKEINRETDKQEAERFFAHITSI